MDRRGGVLGSRDGTSGPQHQRQWQEQRQQQEQTLLAAQLSSLQSFCQQCDSHCRMPSCMAPHASPDAMHSMPCPHPSGPTPLPHFLHPLPTPRRSTISGGADSRSHMLARHRDIMHDFQQVRWQEGRTGG